MSTHARGTFEVKLIPQSDPDESETSSLGRMTLDKQFHGDLEGASRGQMLTARSEVATSAGYVAIERITGTLNGLSGGFVLQHNGIMTASSQEQNIVVVPDSGFGQLKGLAGKVTITIASGKRSYDFEYTLPQND